MFRHSDDDNSKKKTKDDDMKSEYNNRQNDKKVEATYIIKNMERKEVAKLKQLIEEAKMYKFNIIVIK